MPHNQLLTRAIVVKSPLYLMETIYRKRFLIIISSVKFRILKKKGKRRRKTSNKKEERKTQRRKKDEGYNEMRYKCKPNILHFKHTFAFQTNTHISIREKKKVKKKNKLLLPF